MVKWLVGLFASISTVFTGETNKPIAAPPLNTAIISYQETYHAPSVADPGNFPWAKQITETKTLLTVELPLQKATPILTPTPKPTPTPPSPPPPPPPTTADIYLANPEPVLDWYVPITLKRSSNDGDYSIPEMTFTREFWRIEVLAYWAPKESALLTEKDYFKLEVYEKGTDKLIYTMVSGTDKSIHKFQAFKKPGMYYFKTYLKSPSEFEITFTYH